MTRTTQELAVISAADLSAVSGGAKKSSEWDRWVQSQRVAIAPDYKNVVATTAGIKGGPQMAIQVYGADRATNFDKINAAKTLRDYIMGGTHLPIAAPASPF